MLHLLHDTLLRPFLNARLRSKLFIVFGLVALGPMLSFIYYSYDTLREELTSQMLGSMSATTTQVGANLEMKLDTYAKVSTSLYIDTRLQNALTDDYSGSTNYVDAYSYIDSTFNNVLTTNPDISEVTVYTDNLSLPVDNVFLRRLTPEIEDGGWFRRIRESYGSVAFAFRPAARASQMEVTQGIGENKPPRIVLGRLLDNDSLNYPYGYLTIEIPETDLYALMEKESRNKQLFVVSEEGVILSGKDKSLLGQNIAALLPGKWLQSGESLGSFTGEMDGESVYVVYSGISNGWKVVSVASIDSLLKRANRSYTRLLTMAAASVVLAIVLIYITARLFTKRIEVLLQLMRRMERENFELKPRFMGHDEIGQLSFAIVKAGGRMNELINEVYKREIAKKEAEMNVLQAQINPHFLYNALASISALAMRSGDGRIQAMVSNLAKFYRISLNKGKSVITMGEELRLTQSYLAIQQLRFQGLVRVHEDIDEAVSPYPVVKLMLQPFIENAIHHAIWDDEAGINIVIRVRKSDSELIVDIIDDGMGMRPEPLAQIQAVLAMNEEASAAAPAIAGETGGLPASGSGYGIRNVNRRIKVTFGEAYGVSVYSRLGIGTIATIRLPLGGPQ